MSWTQTYNPAGSFYLSVGLALSPILLMLLLLARFRVKGYIAGLVGLAVTFGLATFIWDYPLALGAVTFIYGVFSGLFPIIYIIFTSLLLYNLTVRSGNFARMRASLEQVTDDRRLQLLIIGFAFIAFLDSTAGFLAPVAITTAMLVGMGFPPLRTATAMSVTVALPAPIGVMGISLVVLSRGSGVPVEVLGQLTGKIMPLLIVFSPFFLVLLMVGFRQAMAVWLQCLLVGLAYSLTVLVFTSYVSYAISGLAAALAALATCLLVSRYLPPRQTLRFPGDPPVQPGSTAAGDNRVLSWWPFALLTAMVVIWSQPLVIKGLNVGTWVFKIPYLHEAILRVPPVSFAVEAMPAELTVNSLSSIGTAILVTAILAAAIMRLPVTAVIDEARATVAQIAAPAANILAVFGLAYLMNYSGMAGTLGLAFAAAGPMFITLAPLLAFIICFTTGSNTATDAMMVGLVTVTANRLGVPLALVVAAFGVAAPYGKLIAPQVLAVASAAAGVPGQEGNILRTTLPIGLAYILLIAIISLGFSYLLI